jgi:AbrB family looped-hinge helix DNA binding protein
VETITISPKYQVVIPKSVRQQLRLVPGQKVQAIAYQGRVELLVLRPASELRGILRGLDLRFEREEEDRV